MVYLWIHFFKRFQKACFYFLAPFLAPLFFPNLQPLEQLIFIFFPLGLFLRPLFSMFFGRFKQLFVVRISLMIHVLGSFAIVCIPSSLGIFTPLLFLCLKNILDFFSAPKTTATSLLYLEKQEKKSAHYEMLGMLGTLFAGILVLLLLFFDALYLWRLLYFISGLSFLVFWKVPKTSPSIQKTQLYFPHLLTVIAQTGFSYAIFLMSTHLIHAYMLENHYDPTLSLSLLLCFMTLDILLLPLFGRLSHRIGEKAQMQLSVFLATLFSIPLFFFFDISISFNLFFIRFFLILIGVMFAAPFYSYQKNLFKDDAFYNLSVGRSIGKEWLGYPSISICLFLHQYLPIHFAFGGYLSLLGLMTYILMQRAKPASIVRPEPFL